MSAVARAVDRALALSQADDCIVIGTGSSSINVRWANNTSTTNGVSESVQLIVISIRDGRVGMRAATTIEDAAIEGVVRGSEAACDGKPTAFDLAPLASGNGAPPDWLEDEDAEGARIFENVATGLADLFTRAGSSGTQLYGFAYHDTDTVWLATSAGLRRRYRIPAGTIDVTAKSRDLTRSAWNSRVTTMYDDVDLDAMYRRLEQRLAWSENRIDMDAGRYEVILEPSAVADMLLYQYLSSTARDADEGRSVFHKPGGGNRIGEALWPDTITVYSDPFEPGLEVLPFSLAAGSSSYSSVFDNGIPHERVTWIERGVLRELITPAYWAAKSGKSPAPMVKNLIFPSDGPSLDEMIARTERGLLVTCLWYIRAVDPQTLLLTGLTRDGVFLVEDGEVRGTVNNFRFNMSPVDMLRQATEIGRAEVTYPREFGDLIDVRVKVPALRVQDWNMSSVSQAT